MIKCTEERLIEIIMYDESIETVLLSESKDNALEGLEILNKYAKKSVITGANHGAIYSISVKQAVVGGITEEDCFRLSRLDWMLEDDCVFVYFV